MFAELWKIYSQLAPSSTSQLRFHNCSLRDIDADGCLQRPFFKIALCLGHQAAGGNHPMSIMVTASHNPPGYNGFKIDHLLEGFSLKEGVINEILHCQEDVLDLLGGKQGWKQGSGIFYLGRDKRPTSLKLSSIVREVLSILGYQLIDLGERTTPELVSLSEFLHKSHMKGIQFSSSLVDSFFCQIKDAFDSAIKLASQYSGRLFHKKTICLDFANGVGCESFKNYTFLSDYFDIITTNYGNFDQPNVQCGAEWIYKHYKQNGSLPCFGKYPFADQYFFFDGDSDRIVATKKGYSELLNGDDFNAHFIHILRILFDRLYPNQTIGCVGNLTSNNGLNKYAKEKNVNFQIAAVGVNHLFKSVINYEIGCYFQPSGHGGFYFTKKMKERLEGIQSEKWEAKLLLTLDSLSRNNPRGYALHNMLIFQIVSHFFDLKQWKILQKSYEINKQYQLSLPQLFNNNFSGCKLLQKPQQLRQMMQEVCLKYPSETILLRKSITSPILKLFIQGQKYTCLKILQQMQERIQGFLSKF